MSVDGGKTYGEALKSVTGDAGIVSGPGEEKCIIWDVFNDLDELVSMDVKFKVRADPYLSSTDNPAGLQDRILKLNLTPAIGRKTRFDTWSGGANIKGMLYLGRLGLGLRADFFKTFREDENFVSYGWSYPDTGYYWGYSAGAVMEYDLLVSDKYSLCPFLHIGQAKVNYKYNPEYIDEDHFRYSVFGSIGMGFDIRITRLVYLGTEIEYLLSPWIDVIPSDEPDEALDGFNIGFVIRFVIDTG
jgi:hypothetical protein